MNKPLARATHWNRPSESRFCERSAKPIGLSEALRERQLAWASRGRRWHTRCKSWGSLALPSETFRISYDNPVPSGIPIRTDQHRGEAYTVETQLTSEIRRV